MLCFLLVHDVVSLFDNVVDAQILVICRDFYDTKAESFRIWLGLYMFKCGLHIGEAFFCLSSGPALHNQTEFISADTGENIFFSYEILYGLYKMADVSIAFYMSEMVVDVF